MRRNNRLLVSRPDLARVLAILDSHSSWPFRGIHHLDLRTAIEQARIVAPEEVLADRPVLVVNRDSASPYEHVLLAADRSRMSIGIAHVTRELGLLAGARASVVHALQHTRGATPYLAGVSGFELGQFQQSLRELASDEIDTLLGSAGLDPARIPVFSQESSPFRAIEQVASRVGCDLVVVGTSRFPLFKRVFIGSVSNEVLRGIGHDVLVISPVAARRAHRKAWIASRRQASDEGLRQVSRTVASARSACCDRPRDPGDCSGSGIELARATARASSLRVVPAQL
jgi:nucleotide-binding universal stress UspA family protein